MIRKAVVAISDRIDNLDVDKAIAGAMSGLSPEPLALTPAP